ncbi:MAG: hypothetical protein KF901_34580 [Myxococcales bacterium]|nr:hypothetical protein [Myxococcales bacterium]
MRALGLVVRRARRVFGASALIAFASVASHAQAGTESATSPPDALQWPAAASANAGGLSTDLLRREFEAVANASLCELLLRDAKQPVPSDFDFSKCPPTFAAKVLGRQGKVRWAAGAKPTECGNTCWGRPTASQDQHRDRPNTRYASFSGHLEFELDTPGPNRKVRLPYETVFRCVRSPGSRDGEIDGNVVFGTPVIGDPSFWEGAINFFVGPVNWSRRVDAGIRKQLKQGGSIPLPGLGRCSSIGALAPRDAPPKFDAIQYDVPSSSGPASSIKGAAAQSVAAIGKSATVRFTRITRKPVFGYEPPVDAGTFRVWLNGIDVGLLTTPALPPGGGSAPLNVCKTLDMASHDRLQLIFANSQGGAAWSQFGPPERFGAGSGRTLLTGRSVVVPGKSGIPDTLTGKPPTSKPQSIFIREFELAYTIEYTEPPTLVAGGSPSTAGGGGKLGAAAVGPRTLTTGTAATPAPCQQL